MRLGDQGERKGNEAMTTVTKGQLDRAFQDDTLGIYLSRESFPVEYLHKVIGKNSFAFQQGLQVLEKKFPTLVRKVERKSSGAAHVAITFSMVASSSAEILSLRRETALVPDLTLIL